MAKEQISSIPIPPEVLFVAEYDEKIKKLVTGIQGIDWSGWFVARAQVVQLLDDLKLKLYAESLEAEQYTPWCRAIDEAEAMRKAAIDFVCEIMDARVVRVGADKDRHREVVGST